jgi:hypothetical protein
MMMASIFKVFGQEKGIDDYTLTAAGSLGALANGISRFSWPILQDKYSFNLVSHY